MGTAGGRFRLGLHLGDGLPASQAMSGSRSLFARAADLAARPQGAGGVDSRLSAQRSAERQHK
jgi:hypothetical protein